MSVHAKSKDHLSERASVSLAPPSVVLESTDPLCFWTNHPDENYLVDLRPFATGETHTTNPRNAGSWGGPFSGRPQLIAELAPAVKARLSLLTGSSVRQVLRMLRAWWRVFDRVEKLASENGRTFTAVQKVADINELHEAEARRSGLSSATFGQFVVLVNNVRRANRLPIVAWEPPTAVEPLRRIIPDDQVRDLRTNLKMRWNEVKRKWLWYDTLRAEAESRSDGESHADFGAADEKLIKMWRYYKAVQLRTGSILPSGQEILNGRSRQWFSEHGLEIGLMRALQFPTVEDVETAFHLVLMNTGWNPSTVCNLNGSSTGLVFAHPKGDSKLVLSLEENDEIGIDADKPRAGGRAQYCTGSRKVPSSAPMVVDAYQKRVAPLRSILESKYRHACKELMRLKSGSAIDKDINKQLQQVQSLRRGLKSVWLYVDRFGSINWLDWRQIPRYSLGRKSYATYLEVTIGEINKVRERQKGVAIPMVSQSDFRDIFARKTYTQTGGNVIAVMIALGHRRLKSTGRYLDNNIFATENDDVIRSFTSHLFEELRCGRVDLTILAQLVRFGPLTAEMEERLVEYRRLMRSRVGVGCFNPRHPPARIAPLHVEGRLCGVQRCLKSCPEARFLPESVEGIAMRLEELLVMSERLPTEMWLHGGFQEEMDESLYLLSALFNPEIVKDARDRWRDLIAAGRHAVPGLGLSALNGCESI